MKPRAKFNDPRYTPAWAAGVLDACGLFEVRLRKHRVASCRVRAHVSPETAHGLNMVIGGWFTAGCWRLPAEQQLTALQFIAPCMTNDKKVEVIRAIVAFRLTQARPGHKTTAAVRTFRKKVLNRTRRS